MRTSTLVCVATILTLAGCHGSGRTGSAATKKAAAPGAAPRAAAPKAAPAPSPEAAAPKAGGAAVANAENATDLGLLIGKIPPANRAQLEKLLAKLRHHVRVWAFKDPKNTWALCHGLLALGPKIRLKDGRLAVDAILAQAKLKRIDGKVFPVFVGNAPDGTPLEPHANLVVRSLLDSGVSPRHRFRLGGRTWTVADIYRGVLWAFDQPAPGDFGPQAWTLMAMSKAVEDGVSRPTFVNHAGKHFDMRVLTEQATRNLADEMAFMQTDMTDHLPLVKHRQGIYKEACGGMHFVEAPATWLFDKQSKKNLTPQLQNIEHILEWRLTAETALYRRAWRAAPPQYLRLLAIQDQKFYGHWLEATYYLHEGGIEVHPAKVREAEDDLFDAIHRLDEFHAFTTMPEIDKERHQSYLDMIGDAAHAVYGLSHWLAAGIPAAAKKPVAKAARKRQAAAQTRSRK